LEESGAYVEALTHLETNENYIYDKTTFLETLGKLFLLRPLTSIYFHCLCRLFTIIGRLHFKLNQPQEAITVFETLLVKNPDDVEYYRGLEKALGIEDSTEEKLALYKKYVAKCPRSNLPRRLPLDCTTGDQFLSYLRPYMLSTFAKGVPPLFTDLRSLYTNRDKAMGIEKTVLTIVEELEKIRKSDSIAG